MKRIALIVALAITVLASLAFGFYLHIGQDRSEVIAAIGEPNYSEIQVDRINGKVERCQWGSERVGMMVIIYFRNGKVISFQTKGKVN